MRIRTRSLLIMMFQGMTQASQLIIGLVLVRLISLEMLGSYRQVMLIYTLLLGVFTMNLESSLYYFLPKYGPEKRRDVISQTLIYTSVVALIVGVVMFLTAELFAEHFSNPELATLIRIFACFPIVERIVCLMPAFLISLDKALFSGLYTMLSTVFMILAVVAAFAFGYGITEALFGKILIEAIFALLGILMMVHFSPVGKWRLDKSLFLEQWNYCWPLMITTTVGVLNQKLDGVMISSYFSPEVYAVYSVGAMELPIIALFTTSISSAIMPNMVVEANSGRPLSAHKIWNEATRKSSLLIFPTFAFFLFCGHDFIVLMYTQAYSEATWPFLIYLALLPVRIAIYGAILRALGQTKPILVAALISFVVNLIISIALLVLGRHGFLSYIGPSIGTFCGQLVSVGVLLMFLCKKLEIRLANVMRWKELGRIFVISLFCGVLLWLTPVPFSNLLYKFMAEIFIYVGYFFVALILTKSLRPDEWDLVRLPLTMISNRKIKKTFKTIS